MESAQRLVKPRLRGVFHEVGFYVATAIGAVMVVTADSQVPADVLAMLLAGSDFFAARAVSL